MPELSCIRHACVYTGPYRQKMHKKSTLGFRILFYLENYTCKKKSLHMKLISFCMLDIGLKSGSISHVYPLDFNRSDISQNIRSINESWYMYNC